MATLLLVIIYAAYIGLGVPDSLFGTAWPAIYVEFGIPISTANAVTFLTSIGSIISSLLSGRIIKKFSTGVVTAISTSMTALALLGFSLSNSIFAICLFAIPLGFGAGAIDTAQNNYVALHYNARHMNFLHCFYGIGVAISPYLMSIGLQNGNWRNGYLLAFFVQATISLTVIIALPLWNKAHPKTIEEVSKENKTLSLLQMAKTPEIRAAWYLFIASCSIEALCTIWGSSFLVEIKDFSEAIAAKVVILYFVGLTLSRFVSGLLAKRFTSWNLIRFGCVFLVIAIILLFLPVKNKFIVCAGLFFTGVGVGPIYPNLTHLTPINFGKENSQSVIGSQHAFTYVGIMVSPIIFGFIVDITGLSIFPLAITFFFIFFVLSLLRQISILKKKNRYHNKLN